MTYLLDANVFIQAKNLHYGLDFCPAFWDWLIARNQQQKVFSIEKVADEIEAGNDELAKWVNQRGSDFFLKPDSAMLSALGEVSTWATEQGYVLCPYRPSLHFLLDRDTQTPTNLFSPPI